MVKLYPVIVGILLLAVNWGIYKTKVEAQQEVSEISRMKYIPIVERHDIEIATIKATQHEQFQRIMSELQAINRKLNR
jgi:hypothetical protein